MFELEQKYIRDRFYRRDDNVMVCVCVYPTNTTWKAKKSSSNNEFVFNLPDVISFDSRDKVNFAKLKNSCVNVDLSCSYCAITAFMLSCFYGHR